MRALFLLPIAMALVPAAMLRASDEEKPVARTYAPMLTAPMSQTPEQVSAKSEGCYSCHTRTDEPSMHASPAVQLGCTDCHGGDAAIRGNPDLGSNDPDYVAAREKAHVLPRYPHSWNYPDSANPKGSYTLLNKEAPEYIRFVNPGDYRVVRNSCGACHLEVIEAAERSIMASGAMLWGGAAYNNGIVPFKNYVFGEAYTDKGEPAKIVSPGSPPGTVTEAEAKRGALAAMYPLPTWQVTPPGDVFRVFERGGRNVSTQFAEVGLPNPTGSIQRLEEPGRPDLKQSNRGPGTGLRVAIPVLNIHKTRLNDPLMWFMGTNEQPGDYRGSGCTGCHVIYANDREPRHSLIYAEFGRDGQSATVDPTIAAKAAPVAGDGHGALRKPGETYETFESTWTRAPGQLAEHTGMEFKTVTVEKESGHPIRHAFTRAIPTAQCMSCHMHQPNIFLNSYLGYTMWDYESDAPTMWPKEQKYPTAAEVRATNDRNPEAAAAIGKWGNPDFLRNVYDLNPGLKDTQFADYHGHGWNFRGVFKRDREGNLLDAEGKIVWPDDPEKWRKKGEGQFVPPGTNPGKAVHLDGHPCREGPAMRRLPFLAGQPWQWADLWRGGQRGRDRVQGLPRHRRRVSDPPHLRPGGKTAG